MARLASILIDLRSIVPWDRAAIEESVARTGRLVVVQEDSENCSVGQMIVAHLAGLPEIWSELVAPPILVSKTNVMIGYNPDLRICGVARRETLDVALRRARCRQKSDIFWHALVPLKCGSDLGKPWTGPATAGSGRLQRRQPQRKDQEAGASTKIVVPIMGEGIRNAKVVTLLKKSGEKLRSTIRFCGEVPRQGGLSDRIVRRPGEWKTEVGATVDIGQEIGTIVTEEKRGEFARPERPLKPGRRVACLSSVEQPDTASPNRKRKAPRSNQRSPTTCRRPAA